MCAFLCVVSLRCSDGARYVYRTVKDIRFPLSVRNERAAMQKLVKLVQDSLNQYPTSLEEDRAALKVRRVKASMAGQESYGNGGVIVYSLV